MGNIFDSLNSKRTEFKSLSGICPSNNSFPVYEGPVIQKKKMAKVALFERYNGNILAQLQGCNLKQKSAHEKNKKTVLDNNTAPPM